MFVVFDSNIWIKELALNSTLGSAVRYFISESGGTVAVPEVVQREVQVHLASEMKQSKRDIAKAHRKLLAMFGSLHEVVTPSDDAIDQLAQSVVDRIGVRTRMVPFTFEAAKASLQKIIHRKAPSKNKQQFKDGVIWANCVELLTEDDVWLVTDDPDFFEGGDKSRELAHSLWEEVKDSDYEFRLFPDLASVLKEISHDVELSDDVVIDGVVESEREQLDRELRRLGFALNGKAAVVKKKLFATTEPTRPYCDIEVKWPCVDVTNQGRLDATMHLSASASYNSTTDQLEDVRVSNVRFKFKDTQGEEVAAGGYVNVSAHFHAGTRTVHHTVKVDPWQP